MKTIKKAQGGGLIKKGLKALGAVSEKANTPIGKSLSKKVKEAKFQKNKGKFGMEGENVTLKDFSKKELKKKFGTPTDYTPESKPVVLTAEQKANNARILQEIREGKRKNGGPVKKAKNGTSLGMKSVKAGFDNNPGVTRADIITAATKKAKKGMKVKKAQMGASVISKMAKKNQTGGPKVPKRFSTIKRPDDSMKSTTVSTMKSGGKMKKCRYGCK